MDDLLKAGINKASHLVIVNRSSNQAREVVLTDADTIVTVQSIFKWVALSQTLHLLVKVMITIINYQRHCTINILIEISHRHEVTEWTQWRQPITSIYMFWYPGFGQFFRLFPGINILTEISQTSNIKFMQFQPHDEYSKKIARLEKVCNDTTSDSHWVNIVIFYSIYILVL